MDLTILGSSSATPTLSRHQTALALRVGKQYFLLDCGESAQRQMLRYGINQNRVNCVFISHLHPDHFTGLIGFLTTQSLQKRTNPLHVYGPSGIQPIIDTQLMYSGGRLSFPVYYHTLDSVRTGDVLFNEKGLTVRVLRLSHGLPCFGFIFENQDYRYKLSKTAVQQDQPPVSAFSYLQVGRDYTDETGHVYRARDYIAQKPRKRTFAYITDTLIQYHLSEWLNGITLLYHEATFTKAFAERAEATYHSTGEQAAQLACKSSVEALLIGHFSARFRDLQPLLDEARAIFPHTALAEEGACFTVPATHDGAGLRNH